VVSKAKRKTPWAWAEHPDAEGWQLAGYSRAQAIAYARANADPEWDHCGYIQQGTVVDPATAAAATADVDRFLEAMDESDDFYTVFEDQVFELKTPGAEAEDALRAALSRWARKYVTAHGKFMCDGGEELVPKGAR
jgi:hypothetical protein